MQFVISAIQSVFGTGANISSIRDKNKNSVFSGVVLGSGIGLIILGCVAINIDKYITFMNMDIDTYYEVDIMATSIIVSIELVSLYMYPIYLTKLTYIQLEHSAVKATISKQIANIIRIFCSFISSPFCTSIGLAVSVIYQLVSTQYITEKIKLIWKWNKIIATHLRDTTREKLKNDEINNILVVEDGYVFEI